MLTWQKASLAAVAISMVVAGLPAMTANAASPIVPYGAIGAEWNAKGGAAGFLGQPLDNESDVAGVPGARTEDFAGGSIYWSLPTGAHEIHGYILAEYVGAAGGPTVYGLPLTDETTTPDGIGRYNHFTGGRSIYWTAATGAHAIYGSIRGDYAATGWERGPLGYPVSDEFDVYGATTSPVREQYFQWGAEVWSPATGAHEMHGAILLWYYSHGQAAGLMGLPTTDETSTPDGVGRYNNFTGGVLVWTPTTDVHEVHGSILGEWNATGRGAGVTGYPVTDEMTTPDGVGRFNHFSKGGSIYWTPATGAHEVHGAIRDAWAATGWELGPLGYPTSDEFAIPNGRQSTFQHGYITWSPEGGVNVVVR
ncbi:MAG TPA: hypothetical protein VHN80_30210 [Kineosporiaceae bacterium]|jgi:uncharacterized protein with LGFP repeats|nr:hypothetical protein [Kineosporiaceae bacterium]